MPDSLQFLECVSGFFNLDHSVALLLPDATVWVSGSIPNATPTSRGLYPFEFRVEIYTPPYLVGNPKRPTINHIGSTLNYNQTFSIDVTLANKNKRGGIRVVAVSGGFKTHNVSSQQRLIVLTQSVNPRLLSNSSTGIRLTVVSPPTSGIAPPGWYMVYVVQNGVPSVAKWVQIGGDPAGFTNWNPSP